MMLSSGLVLYIQQHTPSLWAGCFHPLLKAQTHSQPGCGRFGSAHCGRASRRRDVTFQQSSHIFTYHIWKGIIIHTCCSDKRDTYPQLRQRLEQVKYSSGKNELLVMCSSGISPLKLSLRAWRQEGRVIKWKSSPSIMSPNLQKPNCQSSIPTCRAL